MAIRQRGTSWQADVKLPNGKRKRKSFKCEADAIKWEQEVLEGNVVAAVLTMGELLNITWKQCWRDNVTGRASMRLADGVLKEMGWVNKAVSELSVSDLTAMRDYYRDVVGNTGATVNRKLSHINKMLSVAQELELVDKVPHLKQTKELGGRERVLSKREEDLMIAAFEQHEYYKAAELFKFLLDTGCRVSEALRMTESDLSRDGDAYAMLGHFKDKNGKIAVRKVPLTKRAADSALKWQGLQQRSFNKQFRRVAWAIGITGEDSVEFVPHMLRHSCATRLASSGMDLRDIKEWLGHKTIEITMRYAKFQPSRLNRLRDSLEAA